MMLPGERLTSRGSCRLQRPVHDMMRYYINNLFPGSISLGIERELISRKVIAHSDLVLDAEEESSE